MTVTNIQFLFDVTVIDTVVLRFSYINQFYPQIFFITFGIENTINRVQ